MGLIVNPRGTAGSGKTELVRRVMREYGWGRGAMVEPIHRPGRARPIAYRLRHPWGGRPLVVLGDYERTSGGCDTIPLSDGGLDTAFDLAHEHAAAGCDVLLEGLRLSAEHERSAMLAKAHPLHVLRLSTPLDRCARNLAARRRARREQWVALAPAAAREDRAIEEACARLRPLARVEVASFDAALARARELLGLDELRAAA